MVRSKICQILKEARIDAGLTQRQVSKLLHYDRSTLAHKESGKIPFYAWELLQLCKLYQISPEDFNF
jgi:transcriptional regulator with XRE-family HTH domain